MSEGPSDPDLLDLGDIPDTGTGMALPDMGGLVRGTNALKRLALRHHAERRLFRTLAWSLLVAVVGGAAGMVGTTLWAAFYVGGRMERFEAHGRRISQLEVAIFGTDESTHATEGEP
jgi:hypothetical protein